MQDCNEAEKPDTQPTTLAGIKKRAKKVKRERGVSHTQALEIASQAAGFTCYKAARNELEDDGQP